MSQCYQCPHEWGDHTVHKDPATGTQYIVCPDCDCVTTHSAPNYPSPQIGPWHGFDGTIRPEPESPQMMPWPTPPKPLVLKLSRELMHLAMEDAATKALTKYVEGAFAAQHPGKQLRIGENAVGVTTIDMEELVIKCPGIEIELVD